MAAESINPCLACDKGQGCCTHLIDLKLTPKEFDKFFADRSELFDLKKDTPYYQLTIKENGACPCWSDQCSVYEDRPIECRLYPYSIAWIISHKGRIIAAYHDHTSCPLKEDLLFRKEEAKSLVTKFDLEVFGDDLPIETLYLTPFRRLKFKIIRSLSCK